MADRTDMKPDIRDDPARAFLGALSDLVDYGTAWSGKAGGITVPAQARKDLGLADESLWRIFGSPRLGVAIVVGPRHDAVATLGFLLRGDGEHANQDPLADL